MMPTAVSSIVETVIRIICVIWFSWLLLPRGIAQAAAGAMLGALVGEFVGMLVLLWNYARQKKYIDQHQPILESSIETKPAVLKTQPDQSLDSFVVYLRFPYP